MMRNRLIFALSTFAGLLANSVFATPLVIVNQGVSGQECQITPTDGTVFTISTTGDVLINGTYASSCPVGGSGIGSGAPTFTPFSPAPADLTINTTSLPSAGGSVVPNFVVYYANACTGKVTATAGCAAITGAWGTGGPVCSAATNTAGQKYCSPGSASVSIPSNSLATSCAYTFQAINCTNGTASVNSQNAIVNVAAFTATNCTEGSSSGDLSTFGYTRQCAGTVRSLNNTVSPKWDNTYAGLMSGAWPGSTAQTGGYAIVVTVNQNQFGSFKFNTGSTVAGISLLPNQSYGVSGLMSISTVPGDFFGGTSVCHASQLTISSKSGTAAYCKLSLNTDYYLNISNADPSTPHASDCATASCNISQGVYLFGS